MENDHIYIAIDLNNAEKKEVPIFLEKRINTLHFQNADRYTVDDEELLKQFCGLR